MPLSNRKIRELEPKVGQYATGSGVSLLLRTKRMYLREFTEDDSPLLFELDSDPEVMKYISRGKPTSRAHIENDFLPRILRTTYSERTSGFWAAILQETDGFAGWFHLRPDRLVKGSMELGYRFKREFWGMGLATEGSKALIKRAFERNHTATITAAALADNTASRNVMMKCGMQFDTFFTYSESVLPDCSEQDRAAVRYRVTRAEYFQTNP